jgi:carboxypeptidase Q
MKRTVFWLLLGLSLALITPRSSLPENLSVHDRYWKTAEDLISASQEGNEGWNRLVYLCRSIGHRLSGSPGYEAAVNWAAAEMRRDGLQFVSTPPVWVTYWERGPEYAALVTPEFRTLSILGLGGSIPTPPGGITAPVIAVRSFAELDQLDPEQVRDRIVLFNPAYESYGRTVAYRVSGPSRASRLGAVASLVRSIAPAGLSLPHTGQLQYDSQVPIPAAALTVEDAQYIYDLCQSGAEVTLHLSLESRSHPNVLTANVIGEIPGSRWPDEVVVIGGHLDSWDIGEGASDNASGSVVAMEAARLILGSGLVPKRTIRLVLWSNEENGMRGAVAYRNWIGDKISEHVAALELDIGLETTLGFGLGSGKKGTSGYRRGLATLAEIAQLARPTGIDQAFEGGGGADIALLMREGVPALGLRTVSDRYFLWHHTTADTIDNLDPENFRRQSAAVAIMAFVLADMPERLDQVINGT